MARGKKGVEKLNETLSKETPEVQEKLLNDLIKNNDNQENEDVPVSNENNELNNLSNKEENENMEQPVETEIKVGDKVKVKKGINTDSMGRRIHAGLQNYTYTVKNVRPDGIACIACLTHIFNVKLTDLEKIN